MEPYDKQMNKTSCIDVLKLLVAISSAGHDETFQICLDFWFAFAETLLHEVHQEAKVIILSYPKP